MNRTICCLLITLLGVLSPQLRAENSSAPDDKFGDTTRSWLAIQRSNTQATPYNDKLSPRAMKAAQERMEDSFKQKIPQKFIKEKFGE